VTIAEVGHNHNGSIEKAKELIHAAKECGCDYAKFQLYDIDTIKKPGDTNYEELKKSQLSKDNMYELYEESQKTGIDFLCSVFDLTRWEWYKELGLKHVKLATRSTRIDDLYKPILESGYFVFASFSPDFNPAGGDYIFSSIPKDFDRENVYRLYCLSRRQILQGGLALPKEFGIGKMFIGFSDHAVGINAALEALDRGALVIEKHFTFDLNSPGWDQCSSAVPVMMKDIVDYAKELEEKDK